jgi:hypothetical protein
MTEPVPPAAPDGLQPARTRLAWQRTALAAAALALLLFHGAAQQGWDATTVAAVLASITAAVLAVVGRYRDRQLRTAQKPAVAGRAMIAGVAVLVTLTSAITMATLL